ncbi:MAG: glycosyltransferase [Candidatus Sericytochromatia bacterium]|nr:glycosyltransferase [Candidatus Sericytochromatia bacterium]
MRLTGQDIVCVSVMDWEHPFASSRHHLMRALAARNRVLFVNNQVNPWAVLGGLRQARGRRACARRVGLVANPEPLTAGLWVHTPPWVVPMGQIGRRGLFERVYRFNQARLLQDVKQACGRLGFRRPILWISFNVLSSESLIAGLDPALTVYHCTDAIAAMPRVSPFAAEIEARLVAQSDLVICSSPALQAAQAARHPACHLVPNGADVALFERAQRLTGSRPARLAGVGPGPLLGFAGHLEERLDLPLITELARARPDWQILLAGPVAPAVRGALRPLAALPNVHLIGLVPREELPAILAACDALMIPFVHSEQTRAIYPLKLNEYLATGKPVVTTGFADWPDVGDSLQVGDGLAGFRAACERALADTSPARAAARVALARANDWEARVQRIEQLLQERLFPRASLA